MKNRKPAVEHEPGWKKRLKEEDSHRKKTRLWMVVGAVAVVAVVVYFAWTLATGFMRPITKAKTEKPKPLHAIGRVAAKSTKRTDDKVRQVVSFQVGPYLVEKEVGGKDFEALRKGQEMLVTYEGDLSRGTATVLKYEPYR